MKILFTVLFVIFLNAVFFAQTNQHSISKQTKQVSTLTLSQLPEIQDQIVNLPSSNKKSRPKITLQRALKLAEKYLEKEKIDVSSFYLYQAKFIIYRDSGQKQPAWHFWWLNETGGVGNYVQIVVLINSENVMQIPSM